MAAESVDLCLYQRPLVEVLSFFLILVDPQFWKHLCYLLGHKSGENGIACILCSRRQNAHVHILIDVEEIADLLGQDSPLVVAEIVDDDHEDLLAFVEQGKDAVAEDVGTHQRQLVGLGLGSLRTGRHPFHVICLDVFGKSCVGLFFLHVKDIGHLAVRIAELEFPVYKFLIDVFPFLQRVGRCYAHCDILIALLISRLRHLSYDFLAMDVLLQR